MSDVLRHVNPLLLAAAYQVKVAYRSTLSRQVMSLVFREGLRIFVYSLVICYYKTAGKSTDFGLTHILADAPKVSRE